MGALDYVSSFFGDRTRHVKQLQLQTVVMKVRMDCEGCERKVRKSVESMKGVQSVDVNRKEQKVTVTGYVEVNKVLRRVKRSGKRTEIWPYVPADVAYHPYAARAYDKKAPPGYVRNVDPGFLANPNRTDEQYTSLFSDDNSNACAIM
jgi:copper chaperone CopZ